MVAGKDAHRSVSPVPRALGVSQHWERKPAEIRGLESISSVDDLNDADKLLLKECSRWEHVAIIEKGAVYRPQVVEEN